MAWSPDGQYLLAGGTDGAARIHRVSDGQFTYSLIYEEKVQLTIPCTCSCFAGACVAEMLDHKDWVQGVAWDPLNRFVATQGKDRYV